MRMKVYFKVVLLPQGNPSLSAELLQGIPKAPPEWRSDHDPGNYIGKHYPS